MLYILLATSLFMRWNLGFYHGFRLIPLKYEDHPNSHVTTRYMASSLSFTMWVKKSKALTISYERIRLTQWPTKDMGGTERDGIAIWYGFMKGDFLMGPGFDVYYNGFQPYFKLSTLSFIYSFDFRILRPGLLRYHRFSLNPMICIGYIPRVNRIAFKENGGLGIEPDRINLITVDINWMLLFRL